MHRQINPPKEIARRFIFVLCLISCFASAVYLLVALAGQQPGEIILGLLAIGASALFYYTGRHFLDFARLASSFPAGEQEEDIPDDLRTTTEKVLRAIADPDTDWMIRHELRKKLAVIIQEDPRLLDLYGKEIRSAHPFPSRKPLQNDN